MASKQDIITAIKNLDVFLKVPALSGAKAKINSNGSPFAYTGGFNMVFYLTQNTKNWAFRVWHVSMGENKKRYKAISDYLQNSNLPYFAEFFYDEKGILVNGVLLDTIRMEWLEGELLKDYIEKNLQAKDQLLKLAESFLTMTQELKKNNISHGDLQEGNILIDKNGIIKLVDYDSVCIPAIEGQKELVTGLKGYQHPSRFKNAEASIKADYFSDLIIYLSILALSEKPELWDKYQVKDTQYMLFTEVDFENLTSSAIYKDLKDTTPIIDALLKILYDYLQCKNYLDLKPFVDYLVPPVIKLFKTDKEVFLDGADIELSWEVENTVKVVIEPEIGLVSSKGVLKFTPQSVKYTLTARGFLNTDNKTIELKKFPTPLIESIFVPAPTISEKLEITIEIPAFPNLDISIKEINNSIDAIFPKMNTELPKFSDENFKPPELNFIESNGRKKEFNLKSVFNKLRISINLPNLF